MTYLLHLDYFIIEHMGCFYQIDHYGLFVGLLKTRGLLWVMVDQWVCLWLNKRAFCEREVKIFLYYFNMRYGKIKVEMFEVL